jgi:hypothetical protein
VNTDTLSYSVPGYRTRKSRRALPLAATLAAVLALGLAGGWTAHALTTPETPPELPFPTAPETTAPPAPVTETRTEKTPMHEGSDYALTRTATGDITRWDCRKPITVALAGPVPDGATELLTGAVDTLAAHSHLPLRTGTDTGTTNDDPVGSPSAT